MDVSKKTLTQDTELLLADGRTDIASGEIVNVEPAGKALLEEVASLTGLPPDWVQEELGRILGQGQCRDSLTLDDLRGAMLKYLDEMQGHLAEQEASDLSLLEAMHVPTSTLSH